MKSRALLELKSVTKSYLSGHIRSVGIVDVSMTVPMQAMMALAGPSGSGKTTLLNLIGLLDSPDEGTIQFEGSAIQNLTPRKAAIFRNRNIGFVFQDFNLLPVLTALENVEVALLERSITSAQKRTAAIEILRRVDMGSKLNYTPPQLSGGQQQRVAIARALVTSPKLVLADEPTSNLDTENTMQIMEIIREMCKERKISFLLSSHDDRVLKNMGSVIHLCDGRIEE